MWTNAEMVKQEQKTNRQKKYLSTGYVSIRRYRYIESLRMLENFLTWVK